MKLECIHVLAGGHFNNTGDGVGQRLKKQHLNTKNGEENIIMISNLFKSCGVKIFTQGREAIKNAAWM